MDVKAQAKQLVVEWSHSYVSPSPFHLPTIPELHRLIELIERALRRAQAETWRTTGRYYDELTPHQSKFPFAQYCEQRAQAAEEER